MKAASALDYRELAQRRLPRFLFEYIDGGANAEVTMRRNIGDLEQVVLRQRVLQDVSAIDLRTSLLGETLELPVALGPIGLAGMNARRGEVQAARAAETAGVPFCLSTVSTCTIEEVAGATRRPPWLQLYMIRDRGFMRDLLARARAAKCSVLVFTVDMPVPGARYRDYRTGLAGAPGVGGALRRFGQAALRPAWAWDVGVCGRPHTLGNVAPVLEGRTGLEDFFAWMRNNFDPSVTWGDLEWVRAEWKGPLVIKGILDADDAERAKAAGADAIVVSNHGGRQLDGVMSTAQALPLVAERIGDSLPVLVDGGVRSGVDVVRMLALGARSVLLGRAWAYALGAAGEAGVRHLLELMAAEIRVAMALTGARKVADLGSEMLARSRL